MQAERMNANLSLIHNLKLRDFTEFFGILDSLVLVTVFKILFFR